MKEKTVIPGDEINIDFTSRMISWHGEKFTFPALGSVPQSLVIAGGVENLVARKLFCLTAEDTEKKTNGSIYSDSWFWG